MLLLLLLLPMTNFAAKLPLLLRLIQGVGVELPLTLLTLPLILLLLLLLLTLQLCLLQLLLLLQLHLLALCLLLLRRKPLLHLLQPRSGCSIRERLHLASSRCRRQQRCGTASGCCCCCRRTTSRHVVAACARVQRPFRRNGSSGRSRHRRGRSGRCRPECSAPASAGQHKAHHVLGGFLDKGVCGREWHRGGAAILEPRLQDWVEGGVGSGGLHVA